MRLLSILLLCASLAVAGDKPSTADRLVLALDRIEALEAEVAKLQAVLGITDKQVQNLRNAKFEKIAKAAGCGSFTPAFECAGNAVAAGPPPSTPPASSTPPEK